MRNHFLLLLVGWVFGTLSPEDGSSAERDYPYFEIEGTASNFEFNRNWRAYYWREDFTMLVRGDDGKQWRIISREPTPWNNLRMGTTYTGLKVDWKKQPRVKVIGVQAIDRVPENYYDVKLDPKNTATAFIVRVKLGGKEEWKDFYVNNWFHKWGEEADRTMHAYFADKQPPYDIYGWIPGKRAPFSKRSQQLINKHAGAKIFRGFVRSTKDNPFGHELEVTHLLGKDPKTNRSKLFVGDPKEVPKLNTERSKLK